MPERPAVLAIVGPTASGKSALAVALAQRLGGAEIVGTDSMQAYRGMDIGTATPTPEERAGVPHHLLSVWDLDEAPTVVDFRDRARTAIEDIVARGRLPIVVGGSGLYVSAVLDDLDFPGTDPVVRERLEHELAEVGPVALHARLAEVDPDAADAILPSNGRRIVRALEVVEISGGPFVARLPEPVAFVPAVRIGLEVDRAALDARIEQRVDDMWAAGFVEEVGGLATAGLAGAPNAARALGYQQVLAMLAREIDEAEARQRTIDATRRFARRQQRWFARDPRITWLPYDSTNLVDDALAVWRAQTAT